MVDNVTKDSVSLSWSKPLKDGGDKVKGYIVEKKPKGSDKWEPAIAGPVSGTNCTVPNLDDGSEMEFRVRAVNAAGPGEPSDSTGPVKVSGICRFGDVLSRT